MKNLLNLVFILISSLSFAQKSVPDSVQERYQDLKKLYYDYKIEASEPRCAKSPDFEQIFPPDIL